MQRRRLTPLHCLAGPTLVDGIASLQVSALMLRLSGDAISARNANMEDIMRKEKITIEVSPEIATRLRGASAQEREALDALLDGWAKGQDFDQDTMELSSVMDEIGGQARARGLTPKIFAEILGES